MTETTEEALDESQGAGLAITRKSGAEKFRNSDAARDFGLLEFWQWSSSDLITSILRGVLAEYIVAEALGIAQHAVRNEWGGVDLVAVDGTRIEIKSAAYVQSWREERHSVIQFNVENRRGWNLATNRIDVEPFDADVYVFALLNHKDDCSIDPMDLSQWEFHVLATRAFDARTRSQRSITLSSLRTLAGKPVTFAELPATIHAVAKPSTATPPRGEARTAAAQGRCRRPATLGKERPRAVARAARRRRVRDVETSPRRTPSPMAGIPLTP
jgi:hypothetical protein